MLHFAPLAALPFADEFPNNQIGAVNGQFSASGGDVEFVVNRGAPTASYTLSGQEADFFKDMSILAQQEFFLLTGQTSSRKIRTNISAGSFSVTGQTNTFTKEVPITAEAGAFAVSGQENKFSASKTAAFGSFSSSVQGDGFVKDMFLRADAGSFAETGFNVGMFVSDNFVAEDVAFLLFGQEVIITKDMFIGAVEGDFAATGQNVVYSLGKVAFITDAETIALTGQDVGLSLHWKIATDSGSFAFSGDPNNNHWNALWVNGVYTTSGQDVLLKKHRVMSVTAGQLILDGEGTQQALQVVSDVESFASSGQTINFDVAYVMSVDSGSAASTLHAADFFKDMFIRSEVESFTVAFQDIFSTASINAEAGVFGVQFYEIDFTVSDLFFVPVTGFSLNGQDALTLASLHIRVTEAGGFASSGNEVHFIIKRPSEAGSFVAAEQDTTLVKDMFLRFEAGEISVAGRNVVLIFSDYRRFEFEDGITQLLLEVANENSVILEKDDANQAVLA